MLDESFISPIITSLPIFIEVARLGSFTKAAKQLNISQPSVSRSILSLEKYLGVSLFNRVKNQLTLTPEGHKLYLAASNGFDHINFMLASIAPKKQSTKLTLGCPCYMIPWLSTRLDQFSHCLDGAEIELVLIESAKPINYQGIDMMLWFGDGNWLGYDSELLIEEEVFPVCSPALEKKFNWLNRALLPIDLMSKPLLPNNRGENGFLSWNDWFLGFNISYRQCTQYNDFLYSYSLNIESAILGKGVILAWKGTVETQIKNGQLIELSGMRLKGKNGYHLVFPINAWFKDGAKKWARLMQDVTYHDDTLIKNDRIVF